MLFGSNDIHDHINFIKSADFIVKMNKDCFTSFLSRQNLDCSPQCAFIICWLYISVYACMYVLLIYMCMSWYISMCMHVGLWYPYVHWLYIFAYIFAFNYISVCMSVHIEDIYIYISMCIMNTYKYSQNFLIWHLWDQATAKLQIIPDGRNRPLKKHM